MKNIIAATLTRIQSLAIVKFLALLGIVSFLPMFIHIQWLTGPIVNAVLIITVVMVGAREALLIALVPSSVALAFGLLPLPLAPMVPFIMMGNALLVWLFDLLCSKDYWLAIIVAAIVKSVWLFAAVELVVQGLVSKSIAANLAAMMSWSQLFSAIAGGVIAWAFLRFLKFKI